MAYLDRLENARLLLFEVLLVTGELVLLSLQGRLCLLQPPDEPSNPFDSPANVFFYGGVRRALQAKKCNTLSRTFDIYQG